MASPVAPQPIASPLKSVLSFPDHSSIPYPPNALPGARDVVTPYGSMRVYEWGQDNGPRVVFVHGDATPAPLFAKIAQRLVDDGGCRVLLFDLWGRGYSDTPLDVRHDARLYASQISFALASSPPDDVWTPRGDAMTTGSNVWLNGNNTWLGERSAEPGFALVGFSLGCPIALTFASMFPALVTSLVLLGPAGLIRALPAEYRNEHLTRPAETKPSDAEAREAVRLALGVGPSPAPVPAPADARPLKLPESPYSVRKEFDMGALCQWQFDAHAGHAHSFADTIRYGPSRLQHALYAQIGEIVSGRAGVDSKLHGSKILIIFGENDDVVVPSETEEDLNNLVDSDCMQIHTVPGGHGFPYPNSDEISKTLLSFWKLEDRDSLDD